MEKKEQSFLPREKCFFRGVLSGVSEVSGLPADPSGPASPPATAPPRGHSPGTLGHPLTPLMSSDPCHPGEPGPPQRKAGTAPQTGGARGSCRTGWLPGHLLSHPPFQRRVRLINVFRRSVSPFPGTHRAAAAEKENDCFCLSEPLPVSPPSASRLQALALLGSSAGRAERRRVVMVGEITVYRDYRGL